MRQFLRRLLVWMDKRFPEKVVLTQAEYIDFKTKTDARFAKLEAEISKFNVSLGFSRLGGGNPLER